MSIGIIRKVDKLGRVVIPKEMRRVLGIYTGSSIEILNSENHIVLKKFSEVSHLLPFAETLADIIFGKLSLPVLVCDEDNVLVCRGVSKKDFLNNQVLLKRGKSIKNPMPSSEVVSGKRIFKFSYIFPLLCDGYECGYVVLLGDSEINMHMNEVEILCKFMSELLSE